jgi:hypothetical protein
LAILKKTGIVSSKIHKTRRVYSIIDPFIKELVESIVCKILQASKSDEEDEKSTPLSPV